MADGRVTSVGPPGTVEVPAGARVVDGAGCTLLPGFIDAHVHLGLVRPARVLAGGITTARDLGWERRTIHGLRQALAADPAAGPRLLAAGPMLTSPRGYPSRARWCPRGSALEVRSAGEARAAVGELAGWGAAVIKVAQEPRAGPTLPPDVLGAVVEASHGLGLRVTSHCGALAELVRALDAGVDELAHGLWSDEAVPQAVMERMVEAGMVVVPTLHIDPSPARIDNLRRFLAGGGRVVYGTDMGNAGPPAGIDPAELALLVQAGMSVETALAAATSGAAAYLGLEGRGHVAAGAAADLVLVEGDPAADLRVLARPRLVLRDGHDPSGGHQAGV
ncbi:MAG TPA: amidohydrolase family protein [Actinomycetota bacterium]|nr:amidohydrolase family protein [Actinomycetota bacterium]